MWFLSSSIINSTNWKPPLCLMPSSVTFIYQFIELSRNQTNIRLTDIFLFSSLKLHNYKLLILLHPSMYRYRKTRVGSHYGPIGHVWMHCRTYFMSKTSFWLWKMPLLTVKNVHIILHRKRGHRFGIQNVLGNMEFAEQWQNGFR